MKRISLGHQEVFHRLFLYFFILMISILFPSCQKQEEPKVMTEAELITRAREIHTKALTLDIHEDIEVTFFTPEFYEDLRSEKLVTLPLMDKGGLDGAFFAVFVAQGPRTAIGFQEAYEMAMEKLQRIHRVVEKDVPEKVGLALHPEDVPRISENGKKVAIIGIENGYPIGHNLSILQTFYDLGARYITLCHLKHNQICDSSANPGGPPVEHDGLSAFGKKVVEEMNRLGIMVDISHLSKKSMLDVLKITKAPVIASHSSCKALNDHHRNLDDEQLLAIKENGGLVNIVGLNVFIKLDSPERIQAINSLRKDFNFPYETAGDFVDAFLKAPEDTKEAYNILMKKIDEKFPPPSVKDFVDHIDHAVKLIGVSHVGISSDFYFSDYTLQGWKDAGETFNITLELVHRGYTEEAIEKIWSGNLLRVWKENERVSAELQSAMR